MDSGLPRSALLRYGVLGVPLAFAGLPIYVHVPKFYADILHVNLGRLGVLLLILRLFDAVIDPIIGAISDRLRRYSVAIMIASMPVLIAGYVALFNPCGWAFAHPVSWLTGCLAVVYLSFSTLMINYYTMGATMARQYHDHTRIAAFREGFMLVGVLLASLLPTLLQHRFDTQAAYGIFSWMLAPLLILCGVYCFWGARGMALRMENKNASSFTSLLGNSDVRWVLVIAFCNAIPAAISATLFLFFSQDVVHAGDHSGPLLGIYFLSAACAMPLWSGLSYRWGKKRTLLIAMITVIACFIWADLLGAGDEKAFAAICVLSGMTLGADSMLLPSMLSDALAGNPETMATGFGLWNLTNKLTMAFAAGIALPMLAAQGYHSSQVNSAHALRALSFCYAILPCMFKAIAFFLLYVSPVDKRRMV